MWKNVSVACTGAAKNPKQLGGEPRPPGPGVTVPGPGTVLYLQCVLRSFFTGGDEHRWTSSSLSVAFQMVGEDGPPPKRPAKSLQYYRQPTGDDTLDSRSLTCGELSGRHPGACTAAGEGVTWRPLPKGSKLPRTPTLWLPGMDKGAYCEPCYRNEAVQEAATRRFPRASSQISQEFVTDCAETTPVAAAAPCSSLVLQPSSSHPLVLLPSSLTPVAAAAPCSSRVLQPSSSHTLVLPPSSLTQSSGPFALPETPPWQLRRDREELRREGEVLRQQNGQLAATNADLKKELERCKAASAERKTQADKQNREAVFTQVALELMSEMSGMSPDSRTAMEALMHAEE